MRPSANTNLLLPLPDTPTALPECCPPQSPQNTLFQADEPPSQNALRRLASYTLYDACGDSLPLSSLFSPTCLRKTRMLIIFVRNFFCGNCQQYLISLGQLLPPAALPFDTSVAIIGCGAPSLIPSYIELTHCPYPIYTDPSAQLYAKLGMKRTLSLGRTAPEYIQHSLLLGGLKSIVQGLKRVPAGDVRKAGDMDVNGGEFLFVRKPGSVGWGSEHWAEDWRVEWCHRMRNTRDHTEIGRLRKLLAVDKDPKQSKTWTADTKPTFGKRWNSKRPQPAPPPVENHHKRNQTFSDALRRMPSLTRKRPSTAKSSQQSTLVGDESPPTTLAMAAWDRPDELKNSPQKSRQRNLSRSKSTAQILNLRLPMTAGNMAKFNGGSERVALFSVLNPERASVRSSMAPQVGSPGGATPLLGATERMNAIAVR